MLCDDCKNPEDCCCIGHKHDMATAAGGRAGGELQRPHGGANNAQAASRILGRPGPGEPSGLLVAPGRAESVRGRALGGRAVSQPTFWLH